MSNQHLFSAGGTCDNEVIWSSSKFVDTYNDTNVSWMASTPTGGTLTSNS